MKRSQAREPSGKRRPPLRLGCVSPSSLSDGEDGGEDGGPGGRGATFDGLKWSVGRHGSFFTPVDPLGACVRNIGNAAFRTFVPLVYCTTHPEDASGNITSFYGSSCDNNGKDALNTPQDASGILHF
eukprot:496007-Prorocentrum_minimum.AAC.1